MIVNAKSSYDESLLFSSGLTALHTAVISNQLEATRILLRVGASVNVADGKTGQTPLHYAAERNSQQVAKLLLVFGANPSTASYSGCTPAQLASAKSHLEMAKMLERSTFSLSTGTVMTTRKNLHVKEQWKNNERKVRIKLKLNFSKLECEVHFYMVLRKLDY